MKTAEEIRAEEEAAENEDYVPSAFCLHILAIEAAHRAALIENEAREQEDPDLQAGNFPIW